VLKLLCNGNCRTSVFVAPIFSTLPQLCSNVSYVEVEVTIRSTVSRPVRLGVRPLSGTSDQFFFLLDIFFRHLRVCYFVVSSLKSGRVCNLLLLLVLASAVTLGLPTLTRGQVCLLSSLMNHF
jgi:hypothetical protein